ncbi:MAG: hypothetical protein N2512_09480 [Armatimonadetes bacterium]|nr:hypothetical protein [Armatimonadota bacterium]
MLGKIPLFVIPIVAVLLVVGISFATNKYYVTPLRDQLAKKQQEYMGLKQKADGLASALKQLEDTTRQWKEAHAKLQHLMMTRSIPLSFYMPVEAMITLAYELRHDLGPVMTKWLESTGCTIESSVALPAPPGTPPLPPANGFYQVTPQPLTITVRGKLAQIEQLYRSLKNCPRVVTISGLDLRRGPGPGDDMLGSFTLNVYLLVETPPGAAMPAAAGAAGAEGPGMGMLGAPGGMPGMPGGGAPGMGPGMGAGPGGAPPGMGGAGAPAPSAGGRGRARGGEEEGGEEAGGGLGRRRGGGGEE